MQFCLFMYLRSEDGDIRDVGSLGAHGRDEHLNISRSYLRVEGWESRPLAGAGAHWGDLSKAWIRDTDSHTACLGPG